MPATKAHGTDVGQVRERSLASDSNSAATPTGTRTVTFDGRTHFEAPVYAREGLTGAVIDGPAVIEQFDSTTVLPPGWHARLDNFGNIVAERETRP